MALIAMALMARLVQFDRSDGRDAEHFAERELRWSVPHRPLAVAQLAHVAVRANGRQAPLEGLQRLATAQ